MNKRLRLNLIFGGAELVALFGTDTTKHGIAAAAGVFVVWSTVNAILDIWEERFA